jgi:hypothetical protein
MVNWELYREDIEMKTLFIGFIAIVGAVAALSQNGDTLEADEVAIRQAALDYMDGALDGDAARIERAVHPELTKVTPMTLKETGKTVLRAAGASRLTELVRANVVNVEKDKRNVEVTIHDVLEGLVSVKVTSVLFYDLLQLAKIDGHWKIIHVLWKNNPPAEEGESGSVDAGSEREAIKKTALDYIEGAFSGDAERMERALHPELSKVVPVTLPETGRPMLNHMGAGILIEGTRAKLGLLEEGKRNIEVTLLDMGLGLASVKVTSAMYYDFLQMAKIDGQWKIVNVLWKMNPNAPKPTS